MSAFKGPWGFWFFPILSWLFPGGGPGRSTITKPIWQSYELQIPWNWMTNDTGPFNIAFAWDPAKTTVYDALLQGGAICDQGSNWLDIYFNDQKVAPLTWGGSEVNAEKYFNQSVKTWLQSGNNTIHATGGKDYAYPSTVNFSIDATLVITYSGEVPTSIRIKKSSIVEASIVV